MRDDAFIYSALNYELKGRRHKYKPQICYQRESVMSMAMIIKLIQISNIWFNVLGRKYRCGDYYCEANIGECQYCLYMPKMDNDPMLSEIGLISSLWLPIWSCN